MDPALKETFDKFNTDYFKSSFTKTSRIFIELDALKDFRLGAIICMLKTSKALEYVKVCLPEYNKRFDDETSKHFPALGITDAQIDNFIQDPRNHRALVRVSPMNGFFGELPAMMTSILTDNTRCDPQNPGFNIVIGTNDVVLSAEEEKVFVDLIHRHSSKVKVQFVGCSLTGLHLDVVKQFSIAVINSMTRFLSDEKMATWLTTDAAFARTKILSYPLNYLPLERNETNEQVLAKLHTYLRAYFEFDYIERRLYI